MSGGAVTMMILGMVIIWGGLALSIANAVKVAKAKK
ncbi:methionine/alanine import family NSS transporter small subunit [Halalkalibacter wakoensis]|nr:methionine/alanine import family NSS transporter small subunit [Halalkalibacter wakoensis]